MQIITPRCTVSVVEFSHKFTLRTDSSCGYSFPCDADGNVIIAADNGAARENYRFCTTGAEDVIDNGIKRREYSYRKAAVGKCVCGGKVSLDSFTNGCQCGRDYNMSGQELAPRNHWGEETGESYSDIVNHDYSGDW